MRRRDAIPGFLLLGAALALGGCIPRDQTGFSAIGPAHRLDAIVLAAHASDRDSLRGLIQQLDSDDAAARLLAIRALERRTGQTLGYQHDDPPWRRDRAAAAWVAWYDDAATSQASTQTHPQTAPQTNVRADAQPEESPSTPAHE
ncbi:MAG: hypothetical protein R3B68_03180 [Phycisphaerales bacterium]